MFCPDAAAMGVSFRVSNPAGSSLAAVMLGRGADVVVLAHQNQNDLCQWLPYGQELADKGYRVVAFSFGGFGTSSYQAQKSYVADIETIVAHVRSDAATQTVVLMGASMGGTASLVAAASITPAVGGVIALSAPATFDGLTAIAASGSLTIPTLVIAADKDDNFAVDAEGIAAAVPSGLGTLLIVPGYEHGVSLLDPGAESGTKVRSAVESFLHTRFSG